MRRTLSPALVTLLALGGVAYGASALVSTPAGGFTLSVEPRAQAAGRGEAVRYVVRVVRFGGFSGEVSLRLEQLPRGVRARFRRTGDATILTLRPGRRTRTGKRRLLLRGSSGGGQAARWLALRVNDSKRQRYTLRVNPGLTRVRAGRTALFRVQVGRTPGFHRQVRVWPGWLPRGWKAGFAPDWGLRSTRRTTLLYITPPATARSRTVTFVVGSRARGRGTTRRYAVARLRVLGRPESAGPAKGPPFAISGGTATPLIPGLRAPLDLVLTNPNRSPIEVTRLSAAVRSRTTSPGCNGSSNFMIIPFSGGYPLRLAPGSTRLSRLVADPNRWPQLVMRNLPTNQDACKNVRLDLDYSGSTRG